MNDKPNEIGSRTSAAGKEEKLKEPTSVQSNAVIVNGSLQVGRLKQSFAATNVLSKAPMSELKRQD
ncbi:hypothetical protein DEA98_14110 [Brucella pseudogrignonensis]|nr:hypothetical protein [Brucella pseudogrignonensis]